MAIYLSVAIIVLLRVLSKHILSELESTVCVYISCVGASSCNSGDGTDQRFQSLIFMMMMMMKMISLLNTTNILFRTYCKEDPRIK